MELKKAIIMSRSIRVLVVVLCMGLVLFRHIWGILEDNVPVLIRYAANGEVEQVKSMLEKGTEVNVVDKKGNSALYYVIQNGNDKESRKIMRLLIANHIDVRARNAGGQPPIHFILHIGNLLTRMNVVGDLVKHGARINELDNRNFGLLTKLVEMRDQGGIEMLLNWWGLLISSDSMARAVAKANEFGYTDIREVLESYKVIKLGEGWDEKTGLNGLMFAVMHGDVSKVNRLISRGVNVNERSRDAYGYGPLHFAVLHQSPAIIRLLLKNNARVDLRDNFGNRPLHMVAFIMSDVISKSIIEYLIENGADPSEKNKNGKTLVDILRRMNRKELVKFLKDKYGVKVKR